MVTSSCQRSFYNIKKGAFGSRTTSFGYGNKIDLINREGVPPPGAYNQASDLIATRTKSRGFSFGNDRRPSISQEFDIANPGPGKYDRVFNNYSRISYSIRSKYEDPLDKHKNVCKHRFSPWDPDNTTAPPLSIPLELILIRNTGALNVERSANHLASKMSGMLLQARGSTVTSCQSTEQASISTQRYPLTTLRASRELQGSPSTIRARLPDQEHSTFT